MCKPIAVECECAIYVCLSVSPDKTTVLTRNLPYYSFHRISKHLESERFVEKKILKKRRNKTKHCACLER